MTKLGATPLGIHGNYDLFARGSGLDVRIEMARGRVTRTTIPQLASTGPVTFVAGATWSLIHPIDTVPGYLIPDGQPARTPAAALESGGPAYLGPDPNTIWIQDRGDRTSRMILVRIDGRPTGVSIPIPPGGSPLATVPDQVGFLIFSASSGAYDVSLAGTRRLTAGTIRAVGPTRWLSSECDQRARCTIVVIDRSDGARHILRTRLHAADADPGVISPGGSHAALLVQTPRLAIAIIDLATGGQRVLPLPVHPNDDGGSLVWSPDNRWLFTTYNNGALDAVGARTGHVIDLTPAIGSTHPLSQLSIRTGP